MLISGSTALQLFNRLIYPESNLDLYIHDVYREEVGRWLLAQGYLYCPDLVRDPDFDIEVKTRQQRLDFSTCYSAPEMMSVLTFKKSPATDTETELIVQVMVSFSHSPLMQSIFRFHSTVVMNVIAWDRAYCLYPHATLEPPRVSFFLRLPCTRDQKFVDKYTARGWRFSNDFKLGTADGPRLFPYYRWIGDGHSWVIELDTTMVFPPPPSLEPFWWKPSRHRLKFWAVRDDGPWADSYAELNPDFVGGGLLNTHYAAPTDFRHTPAVFRTNLDCTGLLRRVTDIWDGDSQKEENHQSEDDQW